MKFILTFRNKLLLQIALCGFSISILFLLVPSANAQISCPEKGQSVDFLNASVPNLDICNAAPTAYSITSSPVPVEVTFMGGVIEDFGGVFGANKGYFTVGRVEPDPNCPRNLPSKITIQFSEPVTTVGILFVNISGSQDFTITDDHGNTALTGVFNQSFGGIGLNASNINSVTISPTDESISRQGGWAYLISSCSFIPESAIRPTAGTLTATPPSGFPGTSVFVTGTDWVTGSANYEYKLLFDNVQIAQQGDPRTGLACTQPPEITFDVPCGTAPGLHTITVQAVEFATQRILVSNSIQFTVTTPTLAQRAIAEAACAVPTVSISKFTVVPRDNLTLITVTVNPSPSPAPIQLTITRQNGKTGSAIFVLSATNTFTINKTSTLALLGKEASDLTGNMLITATGSGITPFSEPFTVLWVNLDPKKAIVTNGTVSKENKGITAYLDYTGTNKLGFLLAKGPRCDGRCIWITGVQIEGQVMPSDFKEPIVLAREATFIEYMDGQVIDSATAAPDTSFNQYRSDIADSKGTIYDLDGPGEGSNPSSPPPIGTVFRFRASLRQFAVYGGVVDEAKQTVIGGVKVSDDFFWHSYVSVTKTKSGDVPNKDYNKAGDNSAGPGKGSSFHRPEMN